MGYGDENGGESEVMVMCLGKKVSRWSDVGGMDGYERVGMGSTYADQSFIASPTIFIQGTDHGLPSHLAAVPTDQ